MQAILVADYAYTPVECWRHVSHPAREFIDRCLTIDQGARMTAHQALSHPWITGEPDANAPGSGAPGSRLPGDGGQKVDLLPTVKKNFNARRTLHAAIDTIRAINQLRAAGAAAAYPSGHNGPADPGAKAAAAAAASGSGTGGDAPPPHDGDAMEGVEATGGGGPNHDLMPHREHVDSGLGKLDMDPRGHGRGQTQDMIHEQQRRVAATSKGLWQRAKGS